MALTATASPSTRKEIVRSLGMQKPIMIVKCPEKPNIVYIVRNKEEEIEEVSGP